MHRDNGVRCQKIKFTLGCCLFVLIIIATVEQLELEQAHTLTHEQITVCPLRTEATLLHNTVVAALYHAYLTSPLSTCVLPIIMHVRTHKQHTPLTL